MLLISFSALGQDITEDLLLHYSFDNNLQDVSENSYDAINFGASFTEDRLGNQNGAIYFDGINDYINLPNLIELKPELPVSFSFWIRYDSDNFNDRDVFNTSFEEDVNSGIYFNSQQSTGNFAINYGDGSNNYTSGSRQTYVSNIQINTGTWHHVAITVSASNNMKIYINCRELGGQYSGSGGQLQYSSLPGTIGRHDRQLGVPANYFKGALDDFRYWDIELTQEDVNFLCDDTLNINDITDVTPEIKLYPNPTNDILYIQTKGQNFENILIYNSVGQIVLKQNYENNIDVTSLSEGIYYLRLTNNTSTEIRKFIIE